MPSFVNIGAYVGEGTMVDTWATVGSCAQIGRNVHISGGAGIGGVLEPLQAGPVIIEDDCFIGARSEVAEGVVVEQGAVLSMGVFIGASTKIVDRETGEIFMGRVPAYSVVVPGTLPAEAAKAARRSPARSSSSASTPRRARRPASTSCCGTDSLAFKRVAAECECPFWVESGHCAPLTRTQSRARSALILTATADPSQREPLADRR